ncbi:unnamed protein product, partial [marine sediment metagenome]
DAARKAYVDGIYKQIDTDTYTGNGALTRQIAVGFKCSRVLITDVTAPYQFMLIPGATIRDIGNALADETTHVYLHATDGFVVGADANLALQPVFSSSIVSSNRFLIPIAVNPPPKTCLL